MTTARDELGRKQMFPNTTSDSTPLAFGSTAELGQAVEREAFEAWFSDGGQCPAAVRRSGDGYMLAAAQAAWNAWQACAAVQRDRLMELLRTPHRMAGGCPDEVAGEDSRDLDCPACRLMQELGA